MSLDTAVATDLLERTHETSVLTDCLQTVQKTGQGRMVLVSGEAGIGKSALIRDFCDARPSTDRVLWGACASLFTPKPLGPLIDIAEQAGGELVRVIEEGGSPHDAVTAFVEALRAQPGSIVVLEDIHWADEATLDVLRLLARKLAGVPVLLIASYRDDELAVGPSAAGGAGRVPGPRALSSGSSCGRCRSRQLAGWRPRARSTPTSSTARRPATRSSSSKCLLRLEKSPTRSATRCSREPPA